MEEAPKRHIACGICRRRKLKCDGRKPTCSTCQRLNQVCEYSDVVRKAGPKRGYVRSLETRIAYLEKLINDYHISEDPGGASTSPNAVESPLQATEEPMPPLELVKELTEAFFLKVNIIHGVIDRKRYTNSLNYPPAHQPPPFLQYTVMAYAAALTPKYRAMKPMLYERANKYLEKAESAFVNGTPSIHYIVALGLMGHYKTRESRFRLAWLDIGKAWRATIMLSLNMLDAATWNTKTYDTPAVAEARRAFWFIYFCDRAGSLAVSLPPIINPDDVFVKLPMDDELFLLGGSDSVGGGHGVPSGGERRIECLKLEELLHNPNMFLQFPSARVALTTCLVEVNYQILELGRFPKKNTNLSAQDWFNQYTHFDNVLQKLVMAIPLVPPMPASGDEDNKVIVEEKSRRTAVLLIYLWSQAGILFSARTGLHGIQQYPVLITMANPGRLVQRALMSMLEVLLVTRNPHDLEVIGTHPLHPYLLFALAVVILVLADHSLVSLDNFKAPVEYVINTLQQLIPIMPCTELFAAFLGKLAPQLNACETNNVVNRVEDVLQTKGIDLSLPNFLDSNPHASNESSPLSVLSSGDVSTRKPGEVGTPSPQNSEPSYGYTSTSQQQQQQQQQRLSRTPHQSQSHGPAPILAGSSRAGSVTTVGMSSLSISEMQAESISPSNKAAADESPMNLMPLYEDQFNDSLLDIEPPLYLPDMKQDGYDLVQDYDKGLEWASRS